MNTNELLKEIQRLPIRKRIYLIEQALQSIRKSEDAEQMQIAAESLYTDYASDSELVSLTEIDFEDFYETR